MFWACLGAGAGWLLARRPPTWMALFCLILAAAGWLARVAAGDDRAWFRRQAVPILLVVVFALAAWGRQLVAFRQLRSDPAASLRGLALDCAGEVMEPARTRSGQTRFRFRVDRVEGRPRVKPFSLLVVVRGPADFLPSVAPGEKWRLLGRLSPLEGAAYPGGFDQREWAAERGIHHQMRIGPQDCDRLGPPEGWGPWAVACRTRLWLMDQLEPQLTEAQLGLLVGIMLGETGELSRQVEEDFRALGLSHLLAASGMNVAVVAGVILFLGMRVGYSERRLAFWAIGAIWFYCALAGASPSIVRATWMASLAFLARSMGRTTDAPQTLLVTSLSLTFVDPACWTDLGFQLSFAAVVGLLAYGPSLTFSLLPDPPGSPSPSADPAHLPGTDSPSRILASSDPSPDPSLTFGPPSPLPIRALTSAPTAPSLTFGLPAPCSQLLTGIITWLIQASSLTFAATFLVTPILLTCFHQLPSLSLPANLLCAPLAEALLPLGFATAALTGLSSLLAAPLIGLTQLGLDLLIRFPHHLASRFPAFELPRPALAFWLLYGAAAAFMLSPRRRLLGLVCLVAALTSLTLQTGRAQSSLIIRHARLPAGTAVWMSAHGKHVLIGENERVLKPARDMLLDQRVARADVVIGLDSLSESRQRIGPLSLVSEPDSLLIQYGRLRWCWRRNGSVRLEGAHVELPRGSWNLARDGPLELWCDGQSLDIRAWSDQASSTRTSKTRFHGSETWSPVEGNPTAISLASRVSSSALTVEATAAPASFRAVVPNEGRMDAW